MTISTTAAARLICETGDWNVTNLQLQKVLYLAHMVFMGNNDGQPLVDKQFEAWDYGPVIPSLYHEVKKYGSKPIRMGFYNAKDITDTPEEAEIKRACASLLSKPPSRLVDFTHRKNGAWDKNYIPGVRGITIPDTDIIEEYKDLNRGK